MDAQVATVLFDTRRDPMMADWRQALQTLWTRWQRISVRERFLIQTLGWLVLLSLVWRIGIDTAWQTLRAAPQERATAHQQLTAMLSMQSQAKALQSESQIDIAQAYDALVAVSRAAGKGVQLPADLASQNGQVRVQIMDLPAETLAQWLHSVRERAQALPAEAHWVRSKEGMRWSGSVVLVLPQSER